jgi:hypothetical protein
MRSRTLLVVLLLALTAAACGGTDDDAPDLGAPQDPGADEGAPGDEGTGAGDEGTGAGDDADAGDGGLGEVDDEDVAAARELLGLPEDEVVEDAETRIMRRGDEQLAGTMDLRPGRRNLELDEVDGTFVVTRITIETEDGEDIVVE